MGEDERRHSEKPKSSTPLNVMPHLKKLNSPANRTPLKAKAKNVTPKVTGNQRKQIKESE